MPNADSQNVKGTMVNCVQVAWDHLGLADVQFLHEDRSVSLHEFLYCLLTHHGFRFVGFEGTLAQLFARPFVGSGLWLVVSDAVDGKHLTAIKDGKAFNVAMPHDKLTVHVVMEIFK